MLRLDPTSARDMFLQAPIPQVPSLSCKDALGYSIDDYYATFGLLYSKAFGLVSSLGDYIDRYLRTVRGADTASSPLYQRRGGSIQYGLPQIGP